VNTETHQQNTIHHPGTEIPSTNEFQLFRYDNETESGFIVRNEGENVFKGEEWRDGDIVDNVYGSYEEVRAWTEAAVDEHELWRKE
jgi:hypothetical protein